MKDCVIDGKDRWSNFHDPRFEREGDGGVARAELDLHQAPDAVRQLQALVDHVLTLKCSFCYRERLKELNIILICTKSSVQKQFIDQYQCLKATLTLFCDIFELIPSLVHSTPSMVCWISFAAGMSFHVFKKVFFSIAPEQ